MIFHVSLKPKGAISKAASLCYEGVTLEAS